MRNTGRILIVAVALTAPAVHAEVFIGASVGQTTVEQGSFNADANSFKLIFGYRRSGVFSVEGGMSISANRMMCRAAIPWRST